MSSRLEPHLQYPPIMTVNSSYLANHKQMIYFVPLLSFAVAFIFISVCLYIVLFLAFLKINKWYLKTYNIISFNTENIEFQILNLHNRLPKDLKDES